MPTTVADEVAPWLSALAAIADVEQSLIAAVRRTRGIRDGLLGGAEAETNYQHAVAAIEKFYRGRQNLRDGARASGATKDQIRAAEDGSFPVK